MRFAYGTQLTCSALVIALCGAGGLGTAQAAPLTSDDVCPRAVPKLVAFKDASASNDLTKIAAAAGAAAEAYKLCEGDAVVRLTEEPAVNYDRTRAAQYLVVEGRALAATGDKARAIDAFRDARLLAEKVVLWSPMSQTYVQSNHAPVGDTEVQRAGRNTDTRPSRYHDAAIEIRSAADTELEKLGSRRQATPESSPKPR
jgi:hypothetical protein